MGEATLKNFDIFWMSWPVKAGKKQAKKAWDKIKPDSELAEKIIKAVEDHKSRSKKWAEGYIPQASTFLNQERWEDEFEKKPPSSKPFAYNKATEGAVYKLLGHDNALQYERAHTPTLEDLLEKARTNPKFFINAAELMKPIIHDMPDSIRLPLREAIADGLKKAE